MCADRGDDHRSSPRGFETHAQSCGEIDRPVGVAV